MNHHCFYQNQNRRSQKHHYLKTGVLLVPFVPSSAKPDAIRGLAEIATGQAEKPILSRLSHNTIKGSKNYPDGTSGTNAQNMLVPQQIAKNSSRSKEFDALGQTGHAGQAKINKSVFLFSVAKINKTAMNLRNQERQETTTIIFKKTVTAKLIFIVNQPRCVQLAKSLAGHSGAYFNL